MSKANAAMNPVPGHAEHIPDLKNDLDVKHAHLELEAESSDDAVIAAAAYGGPVVDRKELWAYYLYYNGDVSVHLSVLRTLAEFSPRLFTPSFLPYGWWDQNGVGPLGFSMTLFQSLATAAGLSLLGTFRMLIIG